MRVPALLATGTHALLALAVVGLGASAQLPSASRPYSDSSMAIMAMWKPWLGAFDVRADTQRVQRFHSRADSVEWARARAHASRARDRRVVVSLFDRRIWVIEGEADTVYSAPAAVASGLTLDFAGRTWTFRTPRGKHTVIGKRSDPVWTPPDWLYAETALEHGLQLATLVPAQRPRLSSGARLVVRDSLVGLMLPDSNAFVPLPPDEHIVFDGTLFIPPVGTVNRRIDGELGRYALDLGDGYLIHGTPDPETIGKAITHGCIRLADADIEWLYINVAEGTPVFIY